MIGTPRTDVRPNHRLGQVFQLHPAGPAVGCRRGAGERGSCTFDGVAIGVAGMLPIDLLQKRAPDPIPQAA